MTQNNLGAALSDHGRRTRGQESQRRLDEAITAYRSALEVRSREREPQDWAMSQSNLASALSFSAMRAAGVDRQRLAKEAMEAFEAALQVFTPDAFPEDWKRVKNGLLTALTELSDCLDDAVTARLKAKAQQAESDLGSL